MRKQAIRAYGLPVVCAEMRDFPVVVERTALFKRRFALVHRDNGMLAVYSEGVDGGIAVLAEEGLAGTAVEKGGLGAAAVTVTALVQIETKELVRLGTVRADLAVTEGTCGREMRCTDTGRAARHQHRIRERLSTDFT